MIDRLVSTPTNNQLERTDMMSRDKGGRLTIVMPVYNDWDSAALLLANLAGTMGPRASAADMVLVDDCSTLEPPATVAAAASFRRVRLLRLGTNLGHQRAIAIGLMSLAESDDLDLVAVMDSDGEDRPEDLMKLLAAADQDEAVSIVAQRKKRSESFPFRAFYVLYRLLFRVFTGQRIQFGNFCVLRAAHVSRVVNNPNIWNNFPAAIISSKIPLRHVPTQRGKRYAGESRMNFIALVAHGLGAISAFSEAVFIRILIASGLLLLLSTGLGVGALVMKMLGLAIPGWATSVFGFALVISIQALMMPILMAFMLLNSRGMVRPLPRKMALELVVGEGEWKSGRSIALTPDQQVS